MVLFQRDLDSTLSVWNTHRIRPSKNENVPHGRPVVLYTLPEIFKARNYLKTVDQRLIDICRSECLFRGRTTCDSDMFELLLIYMAERGLTEPNSAEEGLDLYKILRPLLYNDLLNM